MFYIVNWNMPGYMPDNEGMICSDFDNAKDCLIESMESHCEDIASAYKNKIKSYDIAIELVKSWSDCDSIHAGQYAYWIEKLDTNLTQYFKTNDHGKICFTENRPNWLYEACDSAHDGLLPCDYIYQWVYNACEWIESNPDDVDEYHESVDSSVMIYTRDLMQWLASDLSRIELVDESLQESGNDIGLINAIVQAQYREIEQVYSIVIEAFKSEIKL